MKLFEITNFDDDWTNRKATIKSLFRAQQSRTHQFLIFLNHLESIYSRDQLPKTYPFTVDDLGLKAAWVLPSRTLPTNYIKTYVSKKDAKTYMLKYKAMVDAKLAYENVSEKREEFKTRKLSKYEAI